MSSKDLEALKASGVDIYALLQVPPSSTDSVIRRAYRKQALIYHPDKNPSSEAASKFHLLTLTLNVLGDKTLRGEYDKWMVAREQERLRNEKMGEERKRMKDELQSAETKAGVTDKWQKRKAEETRNQYAANLERLRKEGALKRSQFEDTYQEKLKQGAKGAPPGVKFPQSDEANARTVRVKWKAKEGIAELFTSDVLNGIMSVFGETESAKTLPRKPGSKYDTGIVIYKRYESAVKAVGHNYSEKGTQWEGTSYRKLSGLLRDAMWETPPRKHDTTSILNKEDMTFDDYLNGTVQKLRKLEKVN